MEAPYPARSLVNSLELTPLARRRSAGRKKKRRRLQAHGKTAPPTRQPLFHHAAELRHILPLIAALEAAGAQDVALVVTPAGL